MSWHIEGRWCKLGASRSLPLSNYPPTPRDFIAIEFYLDNHLLLIQPKITLAFFSTTPRFSSLLPSSLHLSLSFLFFNYLLAITGLGTRSLLSILSSRCFLMCSIFCCYLELMQFIGGESDRRILLYSV